MHPAAHYINSMFDINPRYHSVTHNNNILYLEEGLQALDHGGGYHLISLGKGERPGFLARDDDDDFPVSTEKSAARPQGGQRTKGKSMKRQYKVCTVYSCTTYYGQTAASLHSVV